MTRRPDKKVADFHRRALALLGLADKTHVTEALRELSVAELRSLDTPESRAELSRRASVIPVWRGKRA